MNDILDDISFAISVEKNRVVEERLRVIIQPKPRWLPLFIWRRILGRMLYLEDS